MHAKTGAARTKHERKRKAKNQRNYMKRKKEKNAALIETKKKLRERTTTRSQTPILPVDWSVPSEELREAEKRIGCTLYFSQHSTLCVPVCHVVGFVGKEDQRKLFSEVHQQHVQWLDCSYGQLSYKCAQFVLRKTKRTAKTYNSLSNDHTSFNLASVAAMGKEMKKLQCKIIEFVKSIPALYSALVNETGKISGFEELFGAVFVGEYCCSSDRHFRLHVDRQGAKCEGSVQPTLTIVITDTCSAVRVHVSQPLLLSRFLGSSHVLFSKGAARQ